MEIIFADCFGTVLLRRTRAGQPFCASAEKTAEGFGLDKGLVYRCLLSAQRTGSAGGTLEGAARECAARLRDMGAAGSRIDPGRFASALLENYLAVEKECIRANGRLLALLGEKKGQGARLFLLSDFYCGHGFIEELLRHAGAEGLFEKVYVSCDIRASKQNGKMFAHVLEELGVKPGDVTMYGNSRKSDLMPARKLGIRAVRAGKEDRPYDDGKLLGRRPLRAGRALKTISAAGSSAWSDHAFPLYVYISGLCRALEERGAKDVFFLSREGQFLKRLFDLYAREKNAAIRTHYFYASRNSLYPATLRPFEEEDFGRLFAAKNEIRLEDLLSAAGFSREKREALLAEGGLDGGKRFTAQSLERLKEELRKCPSFPEAYDAVREGRKRAVNAYIASFGEEALRGGMYIADVGWKGSMQDFLREITEGAFPIHGYYIGYNGKGAPLGPDFSKTGLLWSASPLYPSYREGVFRLHYLDTEEILRADHDQVMDYREENGTVTPVLNPETREKEVYDKLTRSLQDEIEKKFARIIREAPSENACAAMYARMFVKAGEKDHKWLAASYSNHYYTFGVTGRAVQKKFVKKEYIRHRLGAARTYLNVLLGKGSMH